VATPRLNRIELWSDIEAAGGSVLSLSPGAILRDLSAASLLEEVNGDDRLMLSIPVDSVSFASGGITEGVVFRVLWDDDTVAEYRVVDIKKGRKQDNKKLASVEAEGVIFELNRPGLIERVESSGLVQPDFTILNFTPTEIINQYILNDAASYFSIGTIDPTDELEEFTFDFFTPLGALRQLAKLTDTELQVLRNGPSDYDISLLDEVGSGATKPFVTVGKNIKSFSREDDIRETANRMYGKGGGEPGNRLTLGSNAWEVTSNSPLTLKGTPVWEDDALNGLYVGNKDGTGLQQISDSANPGTLTVGTPGNFSVGDRLRIFRNSSGDHVTYLEDSASVSSLGAIPGTLTADDLIQASNIIGTPKLDSFTGGVADNWSLVGTLSTSEENTSANFTRVGGSSWHLVSSASGDGVSSDAINISPSSDQPYYSALISLWVVSGAVRLELEHSTMGTFPPPTKKAWTEETGQWVDLRIEGILLESGTVKINVLSDGGAAEWYLDSAMITNAPNAKVFVAENAANELWRRSANELLDKRNADVSYAVSLIDVEGINPDVYEFDELTLGGKVRVIDAELASDVDLRVMKLERDIVQGHVQKTTLESRPKTLTDVEIAHPGRDDADPIKNTAPMFDWIDAWLDEAGSVHIKYRLNEIGQSIKYSIDDTAQPTRSFVLGSGATQNSAEEDDFQPTEGDVIAPDLGDTAFITVVAFSEASGAGRDGALIEFKRVNTGLTVDCQPILDQDGSDWYLNPFRTLAAQSIRYNVTTDGSEPDDPAHVDGMGGGTEGTLSTDDQIQVLTGSPAATVKAAVRAYSDVDGGDSGGTEGPLRVARSTSGAAGSAVQLTWHPFIPDDPTKEGVRFISVSRAATVDFGYKVIDAGVSDPDWDSGGFTKTGQTTDPVVTEVAVTKPADGGTEKDIVFNAEDADGNFAFTNADGAPKHQRIRVDDNAIPTGSITGEVEDGGIPFVSINAQDSDTGSWRLHISNTAHENPTGASDGTEVSGASFPHREDLSALATDWTLSAGEKLYVRAVFYRTPSTDFATQDGSVSSAKAYDIVIEAPGSGGEQGNYVDILDARMFYSTVNNWQPKVSVEVGPDTDELVIQRSDGEGDLIMTDQTVDTVTLGSTGSVRTVTFNISGVSLSGSDGGSTATPFISITPWVDRGGGNANQGTAKRVEWAIPSDDASGGVRMKKHDGANFTSGNDTEFIQNFSPVQDHGLSADDDGNPQVETTHFIFVQGTAPTGKPSDLTILWGKEVS